jgi:hypothetical protein
MEDNWFPWKNDKKKSVRIFPNLIREREEPLYRRDIFILDHLSLIKENKKSDPVYDAMKLYNAMKRKQVILKRMVKIKKILS